MIDTSTRHTTLECQVWTACRILGIGPKTVTLETEGTSAHIIIVERTDAFPDEGDIELAGDRLYDVEISLDGDVVIERK